MFQCFTQYGKQCKFVNYLNLNEIIDTVLFKRQRAEQLEAIKNFQKITGYEKQYEMIKIMSNKIFSVIQDSKTILEASSYISGVSKFPLEDDVKIALSSILENVALFSELVLRFPDMSSSLLRVNNTWDMLLQWGIAFSYQVKFLLDNSTITLLRLTSQELNHVPRDPNYVNPYRKVKKNTFNITEPPKSNKKKKVIKKGPRMSEKFEL